MNQKVIIVVLIAVVLLFAPPIYISNQVDSQFNKFIQNMNSQPYQSIEVIEYDKSWFGSSGKVTFNYDDQQVNYSIPIEFSTNSGWFTDQGIGLMSFSLSVAAQELKPKVSWSQGQPLYQLNGNISLLGDVTFSDHVAALEIDNESISGSLSAYSGIANTKDNTIQYVGQINNIKINTETTKLVVKELKISSTVPSNIFSLYGNVFWYDSDFSLSVEELWAQDTTEKGDSLYLRGLSVGGVSVSDIEQNVGSMDLTYRADQLDVTGWVANDMEIALNIANIDLDFINGSNQLMRQLEQLPEEQTANAMMGYFQDNLFSLLSYEPEFNVSNIQAKIPQGEVNGFVNAKITNIQTLPYHLDDISFWLAHTVSDSEIEMDKAVMRILTEHIVSTQLRNDPQAHALTPEQLAQISQNQAEVLIKNGLDNGFFYDAGGFYKSTLQLKDGVAKINDLSIPITYNR